MQRTLFIACFLLLVGATSAAASVAETNGASEDPSISSTGRYLAFESLATNLAPGDTNSIRDVFVRDRRISPATTAVISRSSTGAQANSTSSDPSISADGRYVAFTSYGSNLVASDTNNAADIFVRDRTSNITTRVSVSAAGGQSDGNSAVPAISDDGRYVAFHSYGSSLVAGDTNNHSDIFVHDRTLATTTRVSVSSTGVQSNSFSDVPSISGDGRYVAYPSYGSNLVAGDTNNGRDIFVYDRSTGMTNRVSMGDSGVQANGSSAGPSLSREGRYVAYSSYASNLVGASDQNARQDVFVHDRTAGTTKVIRMAD